MARTGEVAFHLVAHEPITVSGGLDLDPAELLEFGFVSPCCHELDPLMVAVIPVEESDLDEPAVSVAEKDPWFYLNGRTATDARFAETVVDELIAAGLDLSEIVEILEEDDEFIADRFVPVVEDDGEESDVVEPKSRRHEGYDFDGTTERLGWSARKHDGGKRGWHLHENHHRQHSWRCDHRKGVNIKFVMRLAA